MFCLATRSDLATLDKIATDDATLHKNALSSWSPETKQLAGRILAVLEDEYIPQSNKTELASVVQETRVILTILDTTQGPSSLFGFAFVELLTYLGQYMTLQSKLGCKTLAELQAQVAGVSGVTLAGILAAYTMGVADTSEIFEAYATISALTLLEITSFIQLSKLWPTEFSLYLIEGLSRPQLTTAIRSSESKFNAIADLCNNKVIARGVPGDLDKLKQQLGTFNRNSTAKQIPASLFILSTVNLHWTDPSFKVAINEGLPGIIGAASAFAGAKYGISMPFMKPDLKVPFVSCFNGGFEDKYLLNNDWGLLPNMGDNLVNDILEFLMGFVVDPTFMNVSMKYLMRRHSPEQKSGKVVNLCGPALQGQVEIVISNVDCTPDEVKIKKEQIPISINQKMIVLHQYRNPKSAVYNLTDILKIRGTIDKARYRNAIALSMLSYPSTSYKYNIDGGEVTLTTMDMSEIESLLDKLIVFHEPIPEAEVQKYATQNTKTAIDVFNGQLFRCHIMPIANTPFTIVQGVIHHLIGDGYSGFTLPVRSLQLYITSEPEYFIQRGLKAREVDNHIIAHFNQRQNQLAITDNELKEHWNELLRSEEFSFGVDMMKSFPHPAQPSFEGKELIRVIDSVLWTKLGEVSRQLEGTRFHLLTAAWATVISRYSHQKRINIGTAFHCRKEEWADTVLFASNALPVPIHVDTSISIKEFIREIKQRVAAAKKHEEYPASALVQDITNDPMLTQSRNTQSSNPLFQVEINYYHVPKFPKIRNAPIQIADRLYPEYMQAGLAEISAWFVDMNGKIFSNLKYSTDLYDDATIKQIEEDVFCCLESLATVDTTKSVNELKLASNKKIDTLACGPATPISFVAPVHTILNQAKTRAKETAIVCEGEEITYAQLSVAIANIAERLKDMPKGSVIGVFMERSVDFVVSMLGIMASGCVYLPLNLSNPPERIKTIISDSCAKAVLIHEKTTSMSGQFQIEVIKLDIKSLASNPAHHALPSIQPNYPAYTIFTSGSTGKPKGVLVPHRALANFVAWELSAFKYPYGMTFMQMFEFSFDASLQDVFACLCSGNRLLLAKEKGNKDPEYLVNQFAKYNVSRTNMVPSQLSLVLEYLTQDPAAVSKCKSLRTVGQGGEALHLSSVERVHKILPHVQIVNFYGPTEACILCSYFDCGSSRDSTITELKQWAKGVASSAAEIIPIGRPINNASMLILDEDMNLTPVGVKGEVFIGGQCLALGYLNNPEQTNAKFVTNPFNHQEVLYASGDLAKYLPNGLIQYLGRKDKQIKLRGYRIECAEIESVILFNKQVIKAFVTVKKNATSEYLAAYLTTDASVKDKKPLLEEILQDLKAKVPTYMVPSRMFWMNTFPLTINGKVDENQLPSDLETSATVFGISASTSSAVIVPPKDDIERSLCTYIASLLHLPENQVGTNSNFFEIGGTSIHAFNIVSTVKQNFGYKLDLQVFFKDPTVAALSALIHGSGSSAEALEELKKFSITTLDNYEIVKLKEATDSPSLNVFLVHGAFRNTSVFNSLVQHFPSNFNVFAFQDTNPLDVEELDWDDPFEMEQLAARYVEKILTVQPSGTYNICGYCFGGVLAVEMAVQLLEKKKNICTLALLDSTAPTAANAHGFSTLDSATIYALLATEVMASFNVKKELTAADFRSVPAQEQLALMLNTLEQNNVDSKAALPFIKRAFQHYTSSSTLLINYANRPFAGDLLVFSALEEWAFIDNYNPLRLADLGWKELHNETQVIPTPGNHLSMIKREDACQFIAQKLSSLIEDREGTALLHLPSGRETLMFNANSLGRSLMTQKVANDCKLDIDSQSIVSKMKRAVFYSLHAPSTFNHQPWHFIIDESSLRILVCQDRSRVSNPVSAQLMALDAGCALYILQSLLEVYGLVVEVTPVRGNPALLSQAGSDIQRVPNRSRALDPLVYVEIRSSSARQRARASTILVGPQDSTSPATASTRRSPPPPAPSPKQAQQQPQQTPQPQAKPLPPPKVARRETSNVLPHGRTSPNLLPKMPAAPLNTPPAANNQVPSGTSTSSDAINKPKVPPRLNRTTSVGNVKTGSMITRPAINAPPKALPNAPTGAPQKSPPNSQPTTPPLDKSPPSSQPTTPPLAKSPPATRAVPKVPGLKSVTQMPKQFISGHRPAAPMPPQANAPQDSSRDSPRDVRAALPPTPNARPAAARQQPVKKEPVKEPIAMKPVVSREVVGEVEQLISTRSSNRHDFSTRKPVPFKILKELSNDQFVNHQHNVKVLWINDRAKIQRIAKWAELVDQAIYSSKRLTGMLLSSIAQQSADVQRAIPLQSLELSLMQMTSLGAFTQAGPSEETIKLMKSNIALARGTSRKMLNSAGLAVVCYQGGAPSWQTLMRVGQTVSAILLKLAKHDISTSIWGNCGAMDLLSKRINEPHLSALRDQIQEALNCVTELLDKARLVMPELSSNEGVLSVIRFGYALQESSQKSERLPASKSVTVL